MNSYLKLSQNSGLKFQIPSFVYHEPKSAGQGDFSFLAWFKIQDAFPWDIGQDMNIVHIEDTFRCVITASKKLDCLSGQATRRQNLTDYFFGMDLSDNILNLNQWYLINLYHQSYLNVSIIQLFQESMNQGAKEDINDNGMIRWASSDYFQPPFIDSTNRTKPPLIKMYIGIHHDEKSNAFSGSIRQIQILSRTLDNFQIVKNAAFQFLLKEEPKNRLIFQATLFNASEGIRDTVSGIKASLVGDRFLHGGVTAQIDNSAQFYCWRGVDQNQVKEYVKFIGKQNQLKTLTLDKAAYNDTQQTDDYKVTLQGWIFRDPSNQLPDNQNELLFDHQGIQKFEFRQNTYDKLTVTQLGQDATSSLVSFPRGIWVYLISWHDSDGYGIHVQDQDGKIYSDGTNKIKYQVSEPQYQTSTQIQIGTSFNGFIRGLRYFKSVPSQNIDGSSNRIGNINWFEEIPKINGQFDTNQFQRSPDVIFYFMFMRSGLVSDSSSFFQNFVVKNSQSNVQAVNSEIYKNLQVYLTKNLKENFMYGSLDTLILWDGITCSQGELDIKNLFLNFQTDDGFVESEFQLTTASQANNFFGISQVVPDIRREHKDLTVELWFMPGDIQKNKAQKSLVSLMKNGIKLLSIQINLQGQLVCLPLYDNYGLALDQGILYNDFDNDVANSQQWHHITCTVDSSAQVLRGTLAVFRPDFRAIQEFGYVKQGFKFIHKFLLDQNNRIDKFKLRLGADENSKNSMQKTLFISLRLWASAKSVYQIKRERFKVLELEQTEGKLLSSIQLMAGGNPKNGEYDLGRYKFGMDTRDPKSFNQFTILHDLIGYIVLTGSLDPNFGKIIFNKDKWDTDQQFRTIQPFRTLRICPVDTFISFDFTTCQRDVLQNQIQIVAMKDNQSQSYKLFPLLLNTPLSQIQILERYSFNWSFSNYQPLIKNSSIQLFNQSFQQSSKLAFLNLSGAGNQDKMQVILTIRDSGAKGRQLQLDQASSIQLQIINCIQFYSKTGVYDPLTGFYNYQANFELLSQDLKLLFFLQGCDQSTADGTRLQTQNAELSYTYLGPRAQRWQIMGGQGFYTGSDPYFQRRAEFNDLPKNQNITLRLTAKWSDQIQYSIIYVIQYFTKVQVVVNSDLFFVPSGKDVKIIADQSYIINYDQKAPDQSSPLYSISYSCDQTPSLCEEANKIVVAKNSNKNSLILHYQDFLDLIKKQKKQDVTQTLTNINFWNPFTINAIASTQFIQGDGNWQSFGSIDITWIPYSIGATILGVDQVAYDQFLVLDLQVKNLQNFTQLGYKWTMFPLISPDNYQNGDTNRQFMIKPDSMLSNVVYNFSCSVIILTTNKTVIKQNKTIKVTNPSDFGSLIVTPFEGYAFETRFRIEAQNWNFQSGPPQYFFLYQDSNGVLNPISTGYQYDYFITIQLPQTVSIVVRVKEQGKTEYQQAISSVYCTSQNFTQIQTFSNIILLRAQKSIEIKEIVRNTAFIASTFNQDQISQNQTQYFQGLAYKLINILQAQINKTSKSFFQEDNEFFIIYSMPIFAKISQNQQIFDLQLYYTLQNFTFSFLTNFTSMEDFAAILKKDQSVVPVLPQSVLSISNEILKYFKQEVDQEKFESMIYGFKNRQLMQMTERIRTLLQLTEQITGMALNSQNSVQIVDDVFSIFMVKYGKNDQKLDYSTNFYNTLVKVPVSTALNPTNEQVFSVLLVRGNIFMGTNYELVDKQQEVFSNFSIYTSWRDSSGNYLSNQYFPGKISFTIDYQFQKYKINQTIEEPLTHCVSMAPTNLSFGLCETQALYEQQQVSCNCPFKSFYTVSKDEYYRPYDVVAGSLFTFTNWTALVFFVYLITFFVFTLILTSSWDTQDHFKLNDIDEQDAEAFQYAIQQQKIIPIQSLALKRQVYMMNYVDVEDHVNKAERARDNQVAQTTEELEVNHQMPGIKLYWLSFLRIHPLFQLIYRFDPGIDRIDRFLLWFFQISSISLASFLLFRNFDPSYESFQSKYDRAVNQDEGLEDWKLITIQNANWYQDTSVLKIIENIKYPLIAVVGFQLLLLPIPRWIEDFFRRSFSLQQTNIDDEMLSDVIETNYSSANSSQVQSLKQQDNEKLIVNPTLPIKLLLQLSLLPMKFLLRDLQKKDNRLVPFLGSNYSYTQALEAISTNLLAPKPNKKKNEEVDKKKEKGQKKKEEEERKKEKSKSQKNPRINTYDSNRNLLSGNQIGDDSQNLQVGIELGSENFKDQFTAQKKPQSRREIYLAAQKNKVEFEGGMQTPQKNAKKEDEKQEQEESFDLENLEPEEGTKDLIEIQQRCRTQLRVLLLFFIIVIYGIIFLLFSLEGLYNKSQGHYMWVAVIFLAQAVNYLIVAPIWIWLRQVCSRQGKGGKYWGIANFEMIVLQEDYKHALKFSLAKFG